RRLERDRPEAVVVFGYAGSLDPSLRAGSLILARHALRPGETDLEPPQLLVDGVRRRLRNRGVVFASSRLLTIDQPAGSKVEKTDLWNEFGAAGVDMETWDVAVAAEAAGLPWLALRAVVDTSGQALPKALREWRGETRDRDVVRRSVARPLDWPAYLRLALAERKAARALRRTLPLLLEAVHDALPA